MPKLLVVTATGAGDPTRASIPFHVAANGAAAAGMDCGVALAGDSADLIKPEVAAGVRGIGIPPLAALLEACRTRAVQIYV